MKPTLADTCCGCGGVGLAFRQAGYRIAWACDIDPDARAVYRANLHVRPLGDLAGIDPDAVPPFDVLVCGLPCQAFSTAGRRWHRHPLAWDDPREFMLAWLLRLLRRRQPKAVVIENVRGLPQHDRGRSIGFLVRWLGRCGYRVSWAVIDAAEMGAAQHRERVYLVGSRENKAFDFGRLRRRPSGRILDVLEPGAGGWLDESQYVLLPSHDHEVSDHGLVFCGYLTGKRLLLERGGTLTQSRTHREPNRVYSSRGVVPTLMSNDHTGRYWVEVDGRVRRLTKLEVARLQGFPDTWKWPQGLGRFYSLAGNSVHVGTVAALAREVRRQLL